MVSLPMAAKLLAAVRDDAAVVLVGDPFQLESIEAGTVLADIVGLGRRRRMPRSRITSWCSTGCTGSRRTARSPTSPRRSGWAMPMPRWSCCGRAANRLRWVEGSPHAEFDDLWDAVVTQRVRMVELAGERAEARRRWLR